MTTSEKNQEVIQSIYNSDKPISNFEEDMLGRTKFSKELAKALLNFNGTETFTVALYGKWGSGKTSIINMIIREIEILTKEDDIDIRPIVMKFEPWGFSSKEQILEQFFEQLKNELKEIKNPEFRNKITNALDTYSEVLAYIPKVGSYLKTAGETVEKIKRKDIYTVKKEVTELLKEQSRRIVVIIDDIDRLNNEQIKTIFQLVNSVAGFPKIIYLLSMDKDVVARALSEEQNCDGYEYLEKIIQVPFEIPQVNKAKVLTLFTERLDLIVRDNDAYNFDEKHWSKVYNCCILPYVNNIRDVNRIINSFNLKYDLLYPEVSFIDLIGITTLQVQRPKIVSWILQNKDKLCGDGGRFNSSAGAQQNEKLEKVIAELNVVSDNPREALMAICSLFPKYARELGINNNYVSDNILRKLSNIAHSEKFELYFSFNTDLLPISKILMNELILDSNNYQISSVIDQYNQNGNIIPFLQELASVLEDIPYERITTFLESLFNKIVSLKGVKPGGLLSFSAYQFCEWCIHPLILRLKSDKERFEFYNYILEKANIDTLEYIADEIHGLEFAHARMGEKVEEESKKYINIKQLLLLEKKFIKRLKVLRVKDNILDWDHAGFILYIWKFIDAEDYREQMLKYFKEPINRIKYLCFNASGWTSGSASGWDFKSENDFFTNEELDKLIDSMKGTKIFKKLNEDQLIKIASFVLARQGSKYNRVSINDAKILVETWTKQ